MISQAMPSSRIFNAYRYENRKLGKLDVKNQGFPGTNLLYRDTSREQLDQVARFEDGRRVIGLPGRPHGHATFHQVQGARNSVLLQRLGDHGPCFLQI